jgi:hypothetical protein
MQFDFDAVLFRWAARTDASWYFVAVPAEVGDEIREIPLMPRGFGAVRVEVQAAGIRWRTSIFPDAESRLYHLPVKQAVRTAAAAGEGDTLAVRMTVLEA